MEADGEEWLCDTGLGGPAPAAPLRLALKEETKIDGARFRLVDDEAMAETVIERWQDGNWFALYSVDRAGVNGADFEAANFLCASWPQSPFPNNGIEAFDIASSEALANLLVHDYRIEMDDCAIRALWQRLNVEQQVQKRA